MSTAEVEHEFAQFKGAPEALVVFKRAEHVEEQRVVSLIRAAIPQASVFYYDSVVSVRATPDGASRDEVLVPGDRFTVTDTTVIRRAPAQWAFTPAEPRAITPDAKS